MNVKQENVWAFTSSIIQISVFSAFALAVQLSMLLFLFVFLRQYYWSIYNVVISIGYEGILWSIARFEL